MATAGTVLSMTDDKALGYVLYTLTHILTHSITGKRGLGGWVISCPIVHTLVRSVRGVRPEILYHSRRKKLYLKEAREGRQPSTQLSNGRSCG